MFSDRGAWPARSPPAHRRWLVFVSASSLVHSTRENHRMSAILLRRGPTVIRVAGFVLLFSLVLMPRLAFAQDGGPGNPFADADAQEAALDFVRSLVFWVWIACGIGALVWAAAYWFQSVIPDVYNQMRGMLRNGVLIMAGLNLVVSFIISQAEAARDSGSSRPERPAMAVVVRRSV
ncbi:MAG TPA: hypothetical protein VFZ66_03605 [Herpetosiphonaceae bacterium]